MSDYDDEPKGDREQWAEVEAKFCDQRVADMLAIAKDWQKPPASYGHSNAFMEAECMISARCWEQMAGHLRQPRRIRIERENTP